MLLRELVEKQLGHRGDSRVGVLQAPRHLADVTLDLHHVVQHQVGQHGDGMLTNAGVGIVQRVPPFLDAVEVLCPRLDGVRKSKRQIAEGDE